MPKQSLRQWLLWMEQQHPKEIELGLDRVTQAFEALNIQLLVPVITVAGTNGKGSCVHYLEQLASCHNKNIGTYTSPHILEYNERIRIKGTPVPSPQIASSIEQVAAVTEQIPLTYFEISALSALLLLSEQDLDFIVLEVGLGGRLDAVNVVDSDIALITSIGLDHQDYLGDTLDKIGAEKAGIARKGRPCLVGRDMPEGLFQQLKLVGANVQQLDQAFTFNQQVFDDPIGKTADKLTIAESELHPVSVALALAAFNRLFGLEQSCLRRMQQKAFSGRWQALQKKPLVVADVAHNPAAMKHLTTKLSKLSGEVHVVLGMLNDKDSLSSIAEIAGLVEHWHVTPLETPRSQKVEVLIQHLQSLGIKSSKVSRHDSVKIAIENGLSHLKVSDTLLITGSFYTVADAIQFFKG